MHQYTYQLQIDLPPSISVQDVSALLSIDTNLSESIDGIWIYSHDLSEEDEWIEYIPQYCSIIANSTLKLSKLGIKPSDISIWKLFAYDNQCNTM